MSTSAVPSGREPLKSDGSGFTEPYPSVGERQSPRGDEASKIGHIVDMDEVNELSATARVQCISAAKMYKMHLT